MKKITFLILASAIFFFSCKTTQSSAENADAQNLLDANEISRIDESAEKENLSESEFGHESSPNENQVQSSDEIQENQNADEKIDSGESEQANHDEDENGLTQENSSDDDLQETTSSSNEILPQENSSEIGSGENSAKDEDARLEGISSEEKNPQAEHYGESAPQTERSLSHERLDENENVIVENVGAEADVSFRRDSEVAESNSAQGNSDSQTPPATQVENKTPPQGTVAQNSSGANSTSQNQNSSQRQNAPRQGQRQGAPTDSAQNVSPESPASSERNAARQNSSNESPAKISSTENSAKENSKNENLASSNKSGDEIASEYDFSDSGENSKTEEKPKPIPSRSLTLKRNQFVDIIYPGNGWIYLGEEDGDHFTFYGRKQGRGESTFTLRSKKAGKAILHFYKNDALTGKYIDDYIELNVTQEAALDASHVEAPSYAQAVPQKYERKSQDEKAEEIPGQGENSAMNSESKKNSSDEKKSSETATRNSDGKNVAEKNIGDESARSAAQETAASEKVQTVIQTSPTQEESAGRTSIAATQNPQARNENVGKNSKVAANASSLLEQAQKAYDEKRFADALDLVRKFLDIATENIDAGIFLKGQILEAKSEVRDIKSAIDSYDTVVKNFPQSKFWKRANERGIYLKRFYINIR